MLLLCVDLLHFLDLDFEVERQFIFVVDLKASELVMVCDIGSRDEIEGILSVGVNLSSVVSVEFLKVM